MNKKGEIVRNGNGVKCIFMSDNIEVQTELGLVVTLPKSLPPNEMTCMTYPYTVDLCFESLLLHGAMFKVFLHRQITDPKVIVPIMITVDNYIRQNQPPLALAREFSASYHLVKDAFPKDQLILTRLIRGERKSYFLYSTAPKGVAPVKEIGQPAWLDEKLKHTWKLIAPKQIGVGLDREAHTASIMLHEVNFDIRQYNTSQINKAIFDTLTLINRIQENLPQKGTRIRRRPGDEKGLGV